MLQAGRQLPKPTAGSRPPGLPSFHPRDMAEQEVTALLTHLAVRRKVSASTQNPALSALLFLYRHVRDPELSFKRPVKWPAANDFRFSSRSTGGADRLPLNATNPPPRQPRHPVSQPPAQPKSCS